MAMDFMLPWLCTSSVNVHCVHRDDPAEFRKQLKLHLFTASFNVHWHLLILYSVFLSTNAMQLCSYCNRCTMNPHMVMIM